MNAAETLALLLKNGKIKSEDISEVLFAKIEEELALKNIKIPTITSRTKGNVVQFYTTMPARYSKTGKRHQIVGSTEKEVVRLFQKEAYAVIMYSADEEIKETITVENVVKQYLESLKPKKGGDTGKKKKTTIERYFRIYYNYVENTEFGKLRLSKVKKYHCDDYIEYLYSQRIGKEYITQIKSLVKMAFDFAIARELCDRNFMTTVEINPALCSRERKRETGVWEDKEVTLLENASQRYWKQKKYRYSAVIMIMLFLGCRVGEISALTWDDVDFENGFITFNKTIIEYTNYDTHKKCREIAAPKTEDSRRMVKMNQRAIFWLQELKHRNEEIGINSNQVVVTKNGKIPKEDQLAITFKRFCNAAGVQYKSSHTCRRTYATAMIDGGVPVRQVSNDMGHKKASTTIDGYYKAKKETDEMTAKKDSIFRELYGSIDDRKNLATVGNTPNHCETD
ncbi:MAG: site-specific integrase [Eubacteriales bacterium]|nr:site-specific integrase [Eubacteriales bacterium]